MEYTAVVIRWCYEPSHHINAQPPPVLDITEWCVSRWEGQAGQPTKQHLTMVCVKNKAAVTEAVGNAVVRKAANLWMPYNMNEMSPGSFASTVSMREDTSLTIENMYTKVTSPCRGRSFYEYVTGMADLARALGWSETKNSLCGDPNIMHKLHSQHVSLVFFFLGGGHNGPRYSYFTLYHCVADTSRRLGDPRNTGRTADCTTHNVHRASEHIRPSVQARHSM